MTFYDDLDLEDMPQPRPPEKKVESKAKNERQYWLDLTRLMLKLPYARVAKMVQGWPVEWIRDQYLYVNRPDAKTPAALWMWMWKNPKT